MSPRFRHLLVTTLVVIILVLLVGATYQGVATALERRKYPHPGRLVDVGGHQLHIYCTGERRPGRPTVVLEAPEGSMSGEWGWVQAALAERRLVCSYDRAGLGWSEAGDRPYDPRRVPEELHALLQNADVPAPYILVGQSLGAAFTRLYAARYPADVSALVLVDSPDAGARPEDVGLVALSPWLARTGLLRASGLFADRAEGLPHRDAGALRSFLNRPDHLTRTSRELARWEETVRMASDADLPRRLRVLTVSLGRGRISDREQAERLVTAIPGVSVTAATTK